MKGHIYANTENFMGMSGSKYSKKPTYSNVSGDVIESTGKAIAAVTEAIGNVNDVNKRRQFEQTFRLLSDQEQKDLNQRILNAQTENDKRLILVQALTATNVARIEAFSKQQGQGTTIMLWTIAAVVVIGAGVIIYKKSKKK